MRFAEPLLCIASLVATSTCAAAEKSTNFPRYPRQYGGFNTSSTTLDSTLSSWLGTLLSPSSSTFQISSFSSTAASSSSTPLGDILASPPVNSSLSPKPYMLSESHGPRTDKPRTSGRSSSSALSSTISSPAGFDDVSSPIGGKPELERTTRKHETPPNLYSSSNTDNDRDSQASHTGFSTRTKTSNRPTPGSRAGAHTTVTMDCPIDGSPCYLLGKVKAVNDSITTKTITRPCTRIHNITEPIIVFSIIHTATVTFYGNSSDYTPPYPIIKTPEYCSPFGGNMTSTAAPHGLLPINKTLTTSSDNTGPEDTATGTVQVGMGPMVTFVTTDKNPSVIFSSDPLPNVSGSLSNPYPIPVEHKTVPPLAESPVANQQPNPTFSITAAGNEVLINGNTYSSLGVEQTTVVSVDGGTFTIYPTAIIGEGGTVTKPLPAPSSYAVANPTSGSVGGLPIFLSGTQMTIGGETMTIPAYGMTTKVINEKQVIIAPNDVVVGMETFHFNLTQDPPESDVVVAGGEMLTALGQSVVVVHSKTITYGLRLPSTTEFIGDDSITIGPSLVFVHGMTMGGSAAGLTDTKYEIVGGATITKIAPSVAIINGKIYTIGPGSPLTTTMIAGQYFTMGPMGIIVSSLTMTYPFGSRVITTIVPTGSWDTLPIESSSPSDEDEDSMGSSLRPNQIIHGLALCIAIGVLFII